MDPILFVFFTGCFAMIIFYIVRVIYFAILKNKFCKLYKLSFFPKNAQIKKNSKQDNYNYYILDYPLWRYSKKNGEQDKRRNNNGIIWRPSKVYLGGFILSFSHPGEVIGFVNHLRDRGYTILQNKEEKQKEEEIRKYKEMYFKDKSIDSILDIFENCPTDFESYCAEQLTFLGYDAQVTPPTNDGGFDIILRKENELGIVECKCFNRSHTIGRPHIQKLVGANKVVNADFLMFITTSVFSKSAIEYANSTNVELIDGEKLIKLINKHPQIENEIKIEKEEWFLSEKDIQPFIPNDIFFNHF